MAQNEVYKSLSVADDQGFPSNSGWSRQPAFFYDPLLIRALRRRISESDRYIVHSPTHMIIFELRDDGILGVMEISIISLRDKKRSTHAFMTPFSLGSFELPTTSASGVSRWRREEEKAGLDFVCMESGARIIKTDIPRFGHNRNLRGALVLLEPAGAESLVTNMRWSDEKTAFRYSRCSPCYSAEGVIQFGSSEIIFTRGNGWGILDWNRGARPKADIRYWAAACGMSGGRRLGFCVGHSWADAGAGTENGFFTDGKLHKLDQVAFHIPLSDWLSPWRFSSNDGRLEMVFTPHQERSESRGFLFYAIKRRQVCGSFSGKAQLDDGSVIEFQDLAGFAEMSKTKR
ncbi:MAG: DUF2804 domain-containing protein [Treponema sp.]|jgi:hypothetical protein|nr:DUF2804 domain-containing protein [Treponema sp.]